jgi:hypothetical protein
VHMLILTDYTATENIQYQVCATYLLRNSETGDLRQWTGSFNPRGNQTNTLSPFQQFTPHFIRDVKNACMEENVQRRLRLYHVQTNWVFERLTSKIISVQSAVSLTHPTLFRRSLLARRHGNRSRTIQTFLLP